MAFLHFIGPNYKKSRGSCQIIHSYLQHGLVKYLTLRKFALPFLAGYNFHRPYRSVSFSVTRYDTYNQNLTHITSRGNDCTVKKQRPKNLNLFTIRQPLPAIVSILHRISGIFLFLLLPVLLWWLYLSLASPQSFNDLRQTLSTPWIKFILWFYLSAFFYHMAAGIRHLLVDISIGDSLKAGRLLAVLTLLIAALLIILTGVWLW